MAGFADILDPLARIFPGAVGPDGASDTQPVVAMNTPPPVDDTIGQTTTYVPPEIEAEQSVIGSTAAPVVTKPVPPPAPAPTEQPAADPAAVKAAVDTLVEQAQQPGAQQPAGPTTIEATRTTHEVGKPMSPELKAKQEKAFEQEKEAALTQLDVDLARSMAEQDLEIAKQKKLADLAKRQEAEAAAERAALKSKMDDFDTAIAEYKAHSSIDPDRYKKRLGAGGRAKNAIALFFSTLGSGLARTPNYVAQAIDREVELDLRAQEAEIAKYKGAVDLAGNQVQFFRQRLQDGTAARLAAKASLYEELKAAADAELARYKGPEALARHKALMGHIEARQVAIRAQQEDLERGKTVIEKTSQPVGPASLNDQLKLRELEVDVPQADGSVKTYHAKRREDAIDAGKALAAAKAGKQTLNEIEKLVTGTRQSLSPADRARVTKLVDHLRTQYGVIQGLGALSDKDYEIAGIVGNPESFFQRDATTAKLIKQARQILDTGWIAQLEGRGILRTNVVGR